MYKINIISLNKKCDYRLKTEKEIIMTLNDIKIFITRITHLTFDLPNKTGKFTVDEIFIKLIFDIKYDTF